MEKWQKLPAAGCKKHLEEYKKPLDPVIVATGSVIKY